MKRTLAEELISVTKKFRRMFLEQTVSDLGEVPTSPAGEGEGVDISADEVGAEAYGDVVQEIVSTVNDFGIEGFEAKGVTTFVLNKDGKEITFEISTIDSEPVVAIYTENGRITVSLAPLIGYVQSPEDAVEKIADDEDALGEFSELVGDMAGVEVGGEEEDVEAEAEDYWYGDEFSNEDEFEAEAEGSDVESEESEEGEGGELGVDREEEEEEEGEEEVEGEGEEDSDEVRESIRRRRIRARRLREQADREYDMLAGRRDITVGLIQDSDEKIGGIPVKTVGTLGIMKGQLDNKEGQAVTSYPNLYALFREKEGAPDIEGVVKEEVPSSDSGK
jgi:hypothetical protein